MQVIVDSLLINYDVVGTGKKVILALHGWGDSATTYQSLAKHFGKKYKFVAVDLPGFGKSQLPNSIWGLADYARFVASFTKKLNINTSILIGHSNGGSIAILGLAEGFLTADKLVLLASAGIRDRHKGRKRFIKLLTKSGKLATFWLPSQHKARLQNQLYSRVGSDMLIAPELQETFKKTVEQDIQPQAKKIVAPTLLIYGENDNATPVVYGELYHQLIADSTFEVVGEAGHFVHIDKEKTVINLIEDFIR
jgi:pimeloyl-ACP methyl ester carboxylesterase